MKTGVIVYLVGKESSEKDFDAVKAVKDLKIEADTVEVVIPGENHFDVMDAWWVLTAKGMKRIICMIGEIVNHSKIKLTGRELRLCG